MRLKKLAPEIFEVVVNATRLGDKARKLARAVLVDGLAQADVASMHATTRQRVNYAVTCIERAYANFSALGERSTFIRAEVELPANLVRELNALGKDLQACADSDSRKSTAIEQVLTAIYSAQHKLREK